MEKAESTSNEAMTRNPLDSRIAFDVLLNPTNSPVLAPPPRSLAVRHPASVHSDDGTLSPNRVKFWLPFGGWRRNKRKTNSRIDSNPSPKAPNRPGFQVPLPVPYRRPERRFLVSILNRRSGPNTPEQRIASRLPALVSHELRGRFRAIPL